MNYGRMLKTDNAIVDRDFYRMQRRAAGNSGQQPLFVRLSRLLVPQMALWISSSSADFAVIEWSMHLDEDNTERW